MLYLVVLLSAVAMASSSWIAPAHSWVGGHGLASKLGLAPLAHDGKVIDTPDVTHAKVSHFAAHAKASSAASHGWGPSNLGWKPAAHAWAAPVHSWAPAPAHKSWAPAPAHESWAPAPAHDSWAPKWHGPIAHIELTHDGKFVKDTPEVAHARAEHLAAHAAALHKAYGSNHYNYQPVYGHGSW